MLCMPVCFTHNDSVYPSQPHINNDDKYGCAPLFKSLDPPLSLMPFGSYMTHVDTGDTPMTAELSEKDLNYMDLY